MRLAAVLLVALSVPAEAGSRSDSAPLRPNEISEARAKPAITRMYVTQDKNGQTVILDAPDHWRPGQNLYETKQRPLFRPLR